MTKKTTKKTRKPTQLDRIEGELALVRNTLKHIQALAEERSKNDRKAAVTFHEDIVAQIEANRAHLIRIESRLAVLNSFETPMRTMEEAKAPAPEPHKFKEGDWVVVTGHAGVCGSNEFRGTIARIEKHNTQCSKDAWYIREAASWFDAKNLRPATQAEIDEAERKAEEAKPIAFGTLVKWRDRDALYLWEEPNNIHRLAIKGNDLFSPGTTSSVRSEFTIITPEP